MSQRHSGKHPHASKSVLSSLMLPQDANPRGYVFGGSVLKLIDNAAYAAACRHAGTAACVTASFDRVDFTMPIDIGELVILEAQVHFAGHSSMQVGVNVFAENLDTGKRRQTNSCLVTMVAVDAQGRPIGVPPLIPETEEEKRLFKEALERRQKKIKRD
ncbi:MAG: acyl-CoA thioesterase [Elusimicrobia bacterium]|nr:acyl-CoA thioesterase [Elusimicrobiota bacterium]